MDFSLCAMDSLSSPVCFSMDGFSADGCFDELQSKDSQQWTTKLCLYTEVAVVNKYWNDKQVYPQRGYASRAVVAAWLRTKQRRYGAEMEKERR
jgi:hypothetical protein